ncbi:MAG: hypothetical protein KC656_29900 [Myxococcales bacterium]|nr:hypothetical protein [Myxococcales bacterium]MCB9670829.1 hypothetical protein [Alphaproteobacteria bacterium]MCB9691059.1 hypothetical protein [Alphaproteobacteria bacterium]
MELTIGPVTEVTELTGHARQVQALVRFMTGADGAPGVLVDEFAVQHAEIRSDDGRAWDFYGGWDSALVFVAGTLEIVGHGIQHGFAGTDGELWAALDAMPPDALKAAGFRSTLGFDPEEGEDDDDLYAMLAEEGDPYAELVKGL